MRLKRASVRKEPCAPRSASTRYRSEHAPCGAGGGLPFEVPRVIKYENDIPLPEGPEATSFHALYLSGQEMGEITPSYMGDG